MITHNDSVRWASTRQSLRTRRSLVGLECLLAPVFFLVNFHFFRIKHHFFIKASWSPSRGWFLGAILVEHALSTLTWVCNDMLVSVIFGGDSPSCK